MKPQNIDDRFVDRERLRKTAVLSIVFNLIVLAAGAAMLVLVHSMLETGVPEEAARLTTLICVSLISWGAVTNISSALSSLQNLRRAQELEEAYTRLEDLNREMRAQRHDFLNHMQVIYSLIEMGEPKDALAYMDKLYKDLQTVSRMMRTDSPAVNALLQAKTVEAEQRGAVLALSIGARWADSNLPSWELCRVLANLIDNALDASCSAVLPEGQKPRVELVLGEDLRSWFFSVRNNGPEIDEKTRKRIFEPGFTTKAKGQGMGLYIVTKTLESLGGKLTLETRDGDTVFSGFVPKTLLQIEEKTENS